MSKEMLISEDFSQLRLLQKLKVEGYLTIRD